jgi:hypothetical protein
MQFFASHQRMTRKALESHMRLVFDTIKRLLVIEGPTSWAPPPPRRKPRGHA